MRREYLLAVASSLILVSCGDSGRSAEISARIEARVTEAHASTDAVGESLQRFYAARAFNPVWVTDDKMSGAHRVLDWLENSPSNGLPIPTERLTLASDLEELESQDTPEPTRIADLDVQLTTAVLATGRQIATGVADPAQIDKRWQARRTLPDLTDALKSADGDLEKWVARVQPQHREYEALRQELLRTRKAADVSDEDRHARERVLALNMDRWRWMPDDLGAHHLFVNVPAFELRAREEDDDVMSMRVVVGQRGDNETPIFSGDIKTVVFSPTWNVPERIAREETLPAIRKDASYLERQQMDVFRQTRQGLQPVDPEDVDWDEVGDDERFTFRQRPGPGNALGHVKFLFPNPFDIYLHDTPSSAGFARASRALSHGCVRVSEPARLAEYVLRNQDTWDEATIADAMDAGRERHVKIARTLPVHIAYFTAWPDKSGAVTILKDVYGYDARQAQQHEAAVLSN